MQRSPAGQTPPPQAARQRTACRRQEAQPHGSSLPCLHLFGPRLLGRAHTEQSESNRQMKRQRHRRIEQCIDSNFVAVHNVQHPRRKSGLCKPFGEHYRCRWISFRWFQHEGISACDCNWEHPIGTIAGKLNGVIPTQTPSGWRNVYESTPPEPDRNMRLSSMSVAETRIQQPQAALHFSGNVRQDFAVLIRDDFSKLTSTAIDDLRNANIAFVRAASDSSDQSANASAAERTASSTTEPVASTIPACISPVAGFHTGDVELSASCCGVLIQFGMTRVDMPADYAQLPHV